MRNTVSLVLAVGLLVLFGIIVWFALETSDHPPRLADPAPTIPPPPGPDGRLPSQYRGSYDPNARFLGVLAIVTPLLTTIIGFYFGQRAGEATGEAAKVKAEKKQAEIATALFESGDTEAVHVLRNQGLIKWTPAQPEPAPEFDSESEPDPDA